MPAATRKRAADYTGRQTAALQEAKKVELAEAAGRIALITQQEREAKNEVIDLTGSSEPLPQAEMQEVKVSSPFLTIRLNQDIDQMTWGREVLDSGDYDNPDLSKRRPAVMGPMKYYDFKEGQPYRVPAELANHLDEKGYVSYMGRG